MQLVNPHIDSEPVLLRSLKRSDKERLVHLANNKKIWDKVRDYFPYPYTLKDAVSHIEACQRYNNPREFGIEFKGDLVGVIGVVPLADIYKYTAEIGYWIGEEYWGRGIATNAVKQISEYAFAILKMNRIQAGVMEGNEASKRVLEKAGYSLDGIFRKAIFKNGIFRDEFKYSKLNC